MTRILALIPALTVTVVTAMALWPTSGDRITAVRTAQAQVVEATHPLVPGVSTAVVTGSRVNFRSGPSPYYKIHYAMSYGSVVEVLSHPSADWVELRDLSTGQIGYMAADYVLRDQPLNG